MCNKNGYINASVLISKALMHENKIRSENNLPFIKRKDFKEWIELKNIKLLLQIICFEKNILHNELFFEKKGTQKKGEELLQGTYLHPDLINSFFFCKAKKVNVGFTYICS
jgi:hypothetical protein